MLLTSVSFAEFAGAKSSSIQDLSPPVLVPYNTIDAVPALRDVMVKTNASVEPFAKSSVNDQDGKFALAKFVAPVKLPEVTVSS